MYQRRTLRKLPPEARRLARSLNDLEGVLRAGRRAVETMASMERYWASGQIREKAHRGEFRISCGSHEVYDPACGGCHKAALEVLALSKLPEIGAKA